MARGVDDLRTHRHAVRAWISTTRRVASAHGRHFMNQPIASVELIAATIALLVYVLFAIAAIREPLIFVIGFLLVLELFPPLYFSSSGDRPIYISFFLLPIAVAIVL